MSEAIRSISGWGRGGEMEGEVRRDETWVAAWDLSLARQRR